QAIEGKVAGAQSSIGAVRQQRRSGHRESAGRLANAAGPRMFPVQSLKRTQLLARIEKDLLAVNGGDYQIVVELIERQVAGGKRSLVAIHYLHVVGGQARGAQEGKVQQGDILAGAALPGQDFV